MLIAVALISLLLGAGLVAGLAVTTRSVERSTHRRETARLEALLTVEQGRTADLLTRLAARNIGEYHAVVAPFEPAGAPRQYVTDDTGLIAIEVDDDEVVA